MTGSAMVGSLTSADQRRFTAWNVVLGLAALAAMALLPTEADAACRGGFCVTGRDQNGVHIVDFTVSIGNFTHFNANTPQGQFQIGPHVREFSFRNGPSGQLESFALQACLKATVFSSSRCTPWATFTHTPH